MRMSIPSKMVMVVVWVRLQFDSAAWAGRQPHRVGVKAQIESPHSQTQQAQVNQPECNRTQTTTHLSDVVCDTRIELSAPMRFGQYPHITGRVGFEPPWFGWFALGRWFSQSSRVKISVGSRCGWQLLVVLGQLDYAAFGGMSG